MKKTLKIALVLVLVAILAVFTWFHLPFTIMRRSDIKKGNAIVVKLDHSFKSSHQLPEAGDWKALQDLGFSMGDIGTQPDYKKLSDSTYELIFLEGFDGPYLTYRSVSRKWSVE